MIAAIVVYKLFRSVTHLDLGLAGYILASLKTPGITPLKIFSTVPCPNDLYKPMALTSNPLWLTARAK